MNLIKELLVLKEEEADEQPSLKIPSYGDMQKRIYAVALPYFLKAQSNVGDLSLETLKSEAYNDRFWTSSFDGAHRSLERLADDRGDLDDAVDAVGEAFDEVVSKVFDYYSDHWNFGPGTKLPKLKEPLEADADVIAKLIFDMVPGSKERADAENEHRGTVNAMHKDFAKLAMQQRIGKEGKDAIAPYVDATRKVVADVKKHGASIASIYLAGNKLRIFARLDTPGGDLIPGAEFASKDEITVPDIFSGFSVDQGRDYAGYNLTFKNVPSNIEDLIDNEVRKIGSLSAREFKTKS